MGHGDGSWGLNMVLLAFAISALLVSPMASAKPVVVESEYLDRIFAKMQRLEDMQRADGARINDLEHKLAIAQTRCMEARR